MKRLIPILLAAVIPAATSTVPNAPTAAPPAVAKVAPATPKPVKIATAPDPYVTPATTIEGPATVKRGQLVVLSAKPFDKPAGLSQYSYVWVVNPTVTGILPWPDGSKAVFCSGTDSDPSHYDVTLVANYLYADADGKNPVLKTVEATFTIDIASPAPTPPGPTPPPAPTPPEPTPPPAPTPVVPDGVYKIAPAVYELAKNHPPAECAALAAAYRTLAASQVTTKAELVNSTVPAVRASLGGSLEQWRADLNDLAAKVNALEVKAVADCKVLYGEIATGLEARK